MLRGDFDVDPCGNCGRIGPFVLCDAAIAIGLVCIRAESIAGLCGPLGSGSRGNDPGGADSVELADLLADSVITMALIERRILVWHRHDLRVQDHEPLWQAIQNQRSGCPVRIIPVYCFDPRQWGRTSFGFAKTGPWRSRFLLESVAGLRGRYRDLGADLVIRPGEPEQVLPGLVQAWGIGAVYYHAEVTPEEVNVEVGLQTALAQLPSPPDWVGFWGHTLHHREDLPLGMAESMAELPDLFTHYRKAVERESWVREPYPAPQRLAPLPEGLDPGQVPTMAELGCLGGGLGAGSGVGFELESGDPDPNHPQGDRPSDPRGVLAFVGGEPVGLERVQTYIWERDRLRCYKDTRNGMKGADYSSKFSPWLALGCLSPRWIWAEVQRYETERVANESTYWLIFELLWRDYFRWVCAKYGPWVFQSGGIQRLPLQWSQDRRLFDAWAMGRTGYPLVDANMRELRLTGFMSNRGRQNVASFLTKNLGMDWRMGAEWFESWLIDYDPCSNWGNWNYTAGVGNDGRGFRFFNITKQAQDYDPEGAYVKHWLPELAQIPAAKVHQPWRLQPVEQERFGVMVGRDYPEPMVDLFESAKVQERLYQSAAGEGTGNNAGSNSGRMRSRPGQKQRSHLRHP